MKIRISHAEFKKGLLKDEKVVTEYNDLEKEYQFVRQMLCTRKKKIAENVSLYNLNCHGATRLAMTAHRE